MESLVDSEDDNEKKINKIKKFINKKIKRYNKIHERIPFTREDSNTLEMYVY